MRGAHTPPSFKQGRACCGRRRLEKGALWHGGRRGGWLACVKMWFFPGNRRMEKGAQNRKCSRLLWAFLMKSAPCCCVRQILDTFHIDTRHFNRCTTAMFCLKSHVFVSMFTGPVRTGTLCHREDGSSRHEYQEDRGGFFSSSTDIADHSVPSLTRHLHTPRRSPQTQTTLAFPKWALPDPLMGPGAHMSSPKIETWPSGSDFFERPASGRKHC